MCESFQGEKQVTRQDAERIITEYLKSIFGFALKRCKSTQDAEDLSQDIVIKAYRALLVKDDIRDVGKFIWTIAHNALSNYYRDSSKSVIGLPIDDFADLIADPDSMTDGGDADSIHRLQSEIAYLSRLQRRIVIAYYFENRKQADIANELGIPIGTVKWHLFEAKKELKRGMDTMRKSSELKFNPIKFDLCGFSGSVGSQGSPANLFRSLMAQNIEYSVYREAKTVNTIADELGVSPVYVESEAERLEEYGLLIKTANKYLCNILLEEQTSELNRLKDNVYMRAAEIFALELYDELMSSGILDDNRIWGGSTEPFTFTFDPPKDKNYMLWALIPYIAAMSGEIQSDAEIPFEAAATARPDGGNNICYAYVIPQDVTPPIYFESLKKFCGPCWNGLGNKIKVWTADSEWSEKRVDDSYAAGIGRDLSLLNIHLDDGDLSAGDYAYLAERGYISLIFRDNGDRGNVCAVYGDSLISSEELGEYKVKFRCLCLSNSEINNELINIGNRIREKHRDELDALKRTYSEALLNETPPHLRTMQKYCLQYLFRSDSTYILHCIKALLKCGRLKEPNAEQKKSLSTLIVINE